MTLQEEIAQLEKNITENNIKYANGEPDCVSDAIYDSWVKRLGEIDPDNPLSVNGLQAIDDTGRPKFDHDLITGTQRKCADMDEFNAMYAASITNKKLSVKQMINSKVDGAGVELKYENGTLLQAISRGNGFKGEDITLSAKSWNNMPSQQIIASDGTPYTGSIRGEFLLKQSMFDAKYSDVYANARNGSAGLSKRLDGKGSEDMSFIAYDVLRKNGPQFTTEEEKMLWLEGQKFETPRWVVTDDVAEIEKFREENYKAREGNGIDYGVDGIVVKQNTIDYEDLKNRTPKTQCAIKFALETATSPAIGIEWSLVGSYVTPVAQFKPVALCGTTVQRASLHNLRIMKNLGFEIGALCTIEKRGEIIPQVSYVTRTKDFSKVDLKSYINTVNIDLPTKCPCCGSQLEIMSSGKIKCPNSSCDAKNFHKFYKFFDKLEVDGAGEAFCMEAAKEVKRIADLIDVAFRKPSKFEEWAGGINGQKIVANLKAALSKPMTYAHFVSSFDLEGFGEKKLDKIEDLLPMICEGKPVTIKADGWADKSITAFEEEFSKKFDDLSECMVYVKFAEKAAPTSNKLAGLNFCFTGAAEAIAGGRKKCESLVIENGGKVTGVNKNLSYLVTDDTESGSSKNVKAKELGIPVITSFQFADMLK